MLEESARSREIVEGTRMNARRRLKLSALSFSLPDVSEVGYTPSPSYHPPAQEILEEPEEADEREVEPESGRG